MAALATPAVAIEMPERAAQRVNDYAGLLSGAARSEIEASLARFESMTSTQIVVAIFPSLDGESLEDFTNRLFERWKIGQASRDNGALLAIFVTERKARIEVGYGLEGALTDALAGSIIRSEIGPAFREGSYDEGVRRAVAAMQAATRGEYTRAERKGSGTIPTAVVFVGVALLLMFISRVINLFQYAEELTGRGSRRYRARGRSWGAGGPFIGGGFGGGSWSSGGGGGGGGGFSGGSGGGGSFGGFSGGGGSSGGGGASGGW